MVLWIQGPNDHVCLLERGDGIAVRQEQLLEIQYISWSKKWIAIIYDV